VFEEWQSGFEEREMQCPQCGEPATRLISHTSFQLKGSGWYVTDYAGKKPPVKTDGDATSGADNGTGKGCEAGASKASDTETAPVAKKEVSDSPSAGSAS